MINVLTCNNNLYSDGHILQKLRCVLKFVKFYWILSISEWEKNIRIWYASFKAWSMEKHAVKYYWTPWENALGPDISHLKAWSSLNNVFKTHCTIILDIIHNRMREKVLGSGISHLNLHPFRRCIIAGIHECLYGVVKWLGVWCQ